MKVKFYLKTPPDKDELLRVYLFFRYNGKELQFATGIKIKEKQWNKKTEKVYNGVSKSVEYNQRIEFIRQQVENAYLQFQNKGLIPDTDTLKQKLNELINKPTEKQKGFFEYFNEFAEIRNTTSLSKTTYQTYLSTIQYLKTFQDKYKYQVNFNTLNDAFYSKFYNFLIVDKDLQDNTFDKYIKNINTFSNWCFANNLYESNKSIKLKRRPLNQNPLSLTIDEFKTIYNSDFGDNTTLNNVRDLFCFGCVTGIRIAKLFELKPESVQNNEIVYNTDKSNKHVKPPVTEFALNIINRHKGNKYLLPQMSEKHFNEQIKVLAKQLNLDRTTTKMIYKGRNTVEKHFKIYEIISSKFMKKTYVTYLITCGISANEIGKFTGNTAETIIHYIDHNNTNTSEKIKQGFENI